MARISVLVLDHAAIERLFLPHQMVDRWWQPILDEIEAFAIDNIVENNKGWQTGVLVGSLRRSVIPAGRQRLLSYIRAECPHATLYHEGNGVEGGFITPKFKTFMVFPGKYKTKDWRAKKVKTFGGNPFLTDALRDALRLNGVLG